MQYCVATEEFLRFCAVERRLSPHTIQAYTSDLTDFGKWLPNDLSLADVSPPHLTRYLAELVKDRNLATATVRRRFACLRGFFRRLAKAGLLTDPFRDWQLQLARRKRLPRSLSRHEISTLLSSADTEGSFQIAIRLMVSTGLRVGEVCKIEIGDVSSDASSLRVHGKGSRDRIVFVTDQTLRRDLRDLVANRRDSNAPTPALLLNKVGRAMRPQSVRSKLRRLAKAEGVARRVTPHMLRHTAATLLIETGVDIRFVQRLLGHSSIATTEIYTHVSDQALQATLERANVLGALELG